MKQETFYSVIFDDGRESTRRLFKNKENAIKKFEEQKKNFNLDQKKEKDYISLTDGKGFTRIEDWRDWRRLELREKTRDD